jgi:hypothetical protein
VHDSLHPGENQPPGPHASTWFPDDHTNEPAGARRRQNNDSDDDEIEMVGTSTSLKCPLSLQVWPPCANSQFSRAWHQLLGTFIKQKKTRY